MTNHYAAGRRVEQQVMDDLGRYGYDCIRSAASKGAADVVAVGDGEILFVQVKKSGKSLPAPAEREQVLRVANRAPFGKGLVAFKMPDPADGRKHRIVYRLLVGTGPREFLPWMPMGEVTQDAVPDGDRAPAV